MRFILTNGLSALADKTGGRMFVLSAVSTFTFSKRANSVSSLIYHCLHVSPFYFCCACIKPFNGIMDHVQILVLGMFRASESRPDPR